VVDQGFEIALLNFRVQIVALFSFWLARVRFRRAVTKHKIPWKFGFRIAWRYGVFKSCFTPRTATRTEGYNLCNVCKAHQTVSSDLPIPLILHM
jgi:hypothetical protein